MKLLAISLLSSLLASTAFAHEGAWTMRYKNASGAACCWVNHDCNPADVVVLNSAKGEVWVGNDLLTLPVGSIHPMPADASEPLGVSGVICLRRPLEPVTADNVRCLFFRSGSW